MTSMYAIGVRKWYSANMPIRIINAKLFHNVLFEEILKTLLLGFRFEKTNLEDCYIFIENKSTTQIIK